LHGAINVDLDGSNKTQDECGKDPGNHGWLEKPYSTMPALVTNIPAFRVCCPAWFTEPRINPFHCTFFYDCGEKVVRKRILG